MDAALIRRQRRPKQSGGLVALRFAIVGLAAVLFSIIGAVLLGVGAIAGVYAYYSEGLPSAEEIGRRSVETAFQTTRIYDRTGKKVLYEIIPPEGDDVGRRTIVPLARIPVHLRNATIAMEDKTFYTNLGGINWEGTLRAAWGIARDEYSGGGSSIAQQLARSVKIFSDEDRFTRSYDRKIREMILAYELTQRYPGIEGRDKILEMYLNTIFYGHFAYGIEAAAQTYFGKHVDQLTLAESSMLVPLGNSPAKNPIDSYAEAKARQEIVLDQMFLQGYITAEEAQKAKQERLTIAPLGFDMLAPHYVLYVRDLLVEKYGSEKVYGGGLQVISALDMDIQEQAEKVVREDSAKIREKYNANNAAMVVLDAKTSEIKALVGSVDYSNRTIDGQVNMALSPRQPGSSFKPFTYATAFAQGYTPATMVMDVRTSFVAPDDMTGTPYVPENYSRTFRGPMLLRRALACSYNVPAVAMMAKVGTRSVADTAYAMGLTVLGISMTQDSVVPIPESANRTLSLALGGYEVRLLDMAYAFSVFANSGDMVGQPVSADQFRPGYRTLDPVAILKVTDADGNVLEEYKQPQRQQVLRPEVAFLLTDILSDNNARAPAFGYDSVLKLQERPAAVKTGTTNNFHDGWTVGYTPQYVVGVWVGNSDNAEMKTAPNGVTPDGVRVAAPMWQDLMIKLHSGLPVENFVRPPGLDMAIVDATSGKQPTKYSTQRMQEIFIKGTVPSEPDDIHQPFQICKQSGKLATQYCPTDQLEGKVFEIYPPEADDWVRDEKIPQPPAEYCDLHGPNLSNTEVAITSPRSMAAVRGIVSIMGNAKSGGLQKYWLQVGEGMAPKAWANIGPEHNNRVDNNVLESWDTKDQKGLYTLQLSVSDGGNLKQASVPVIVDNISPTIKIQAPVNGQDPYTEKDEWINIQVDAQDNVAMDRVEFYLDDKLLGFSKVAPYSMRWMIPKGHTGEHTVYVMAYDTAGNVLKSDPVKARVVRSQP